MGDKCGHLWISTIFSEEEVKHIIRAAKDLKKANNERTIMARVPVFVSNDKLFDLLKVFDMVVIGNDKALTHILTEVEEENRELNQIKAEAPKYGKWKLLRISDLEAFHQKLQTHNIPSYRAVQLSSFEKPGTPPHVINQEPSQILKAGPVEKNSILVLSAKTKPALDHLSQSFLSFLSTTSASLEDIVLSSNAGRPHHPIRRAIIGKDKNEMIALLKTKQFISVPRGEVRKLSPPQRNSICFLFPGISVKDIRSFRSLYHTTPYLKELLGQCDSLYQEVTGKESLLTFLQPTSSFSRERREEWYTFFTLTQYCLAKLWMHWGVQPGAVLGHSLGEVAAALVCGVMDLEEYLRISLPVARHLLQSSLDVPAYLMAVNVDRDEIEVLMETFFQNNEAVDHLSHSWIDVACENAATQTVVVSPPRTLSAFKEFCLKRGVQGKIFQWDFCPHSRAVEGACQRSLEQFNRLTPRPMKIPYISSYTGEIVSEKDVTGKHWYDVFRGRVNYRKACGTVKDKGSPTGFLEIGFSTYLSKITEENLQDPEYLCLSTLPKEGILSSLGQLYTWGVNVNWSNFHDKDAFYAEGGQRVPLPGYPFQRVGGTWEIESELLERRGDKEGRAKLPMHYQKDGV